MRQSPRPSSRRLQVYVLVSADIGTRRAMLEGIARYVHERDDWDVLVVTEAKPFDYLVPLIAQADGIVASRVEEDTQDLLPTLKCPIVALGYEKPPLSAVLVDEVAIGWLAADHFHQQGLRHMAFCGLPGTAFSDGRQEGARQRCRELGLPFVVYEGPVYTMMERHPEAARGFRQWLQGLTRPCGLLCATTEHAHAVLHHGRILGLSVPGDLAVLGVGVDEYLSGIARPHLSVIDEANDTMGYEAARLLQRLMHGQPSPALPIRIPPRGVIVRESTDLVYLDDPDVARALRLIRENACSGITVEQVTQQLAISRRTLERSFRNMLDRSPHEEIQRIRLARARELLVRTTLSLAQVAQQSGFSSSAKLCEAFRLQLKTTPRAYRLSGGLAGRV